MVLKLHRPGEGYIGSERSPTGVTDITTGSQSSKYIKEFSLNISTHGSITFMLLLFYTDASPVAMNQYKMYIDELL